MSSNGIKTSYWGPHAWAYLFSSIAGSYPITVDLKNKTHQRIVKSFQQIFSSLQHTLPCSFCRESYKLYIKDIPISNYLHSRKSMMKWLYLIHDKVNKKLMCQEAELFEAKKASLLKKKVTAEKLRSEMKHLRDTILKTKPSPSFEKVIAMYEKHRA